MTSAIQATRGLSIHGETTRLRTVLRLRATLAGALRALAHAIVQEPMPAMVVRDGPLSPARVTLGEPPADLDAAMLWFERPEREAFVAGFVCAGGRVDKAGPTADSYMGNLRYSRGKGRSTDA